MRIMKSLFIFLICFGPVFLFGQKKPNNSIHPELKPKTANVFSKAKVVNNTFASQMRRTNFTKVKLVAVDRTPAGFKPKGTKTKATGNLILSTKKESIKEQ